MRIYVSNLLGVLALTACTAYAQDVVVAGTNLVKFTGCNSDQQTMINEAWFDAIKLTNAAKGNFKWHEEAEVNFLGPAALNEDLQKNISGKFYFLNSLTTRRLDPLQIL
jgi:hypothetical protein